MPESVSPGEARQGKAIPWGSIGKRGWLEMDRFVEVEMVEMCVFSWGGWESRLMLCQAAGMSTASSDSRSVTQSITHSVWLDDLYCSQGDK